MTLIQVGRYAENLRRLLGLTGDVEGAGFEASPELQPSLVLENDRPEWAFLRGERFYSGTGSEAAVAASLSQFQINNPTNSGILSIITSITCRGTAGLVSFWEARLGSTVTTQAAGTVSARDGRWGGAANRVATKLFSETVAAGTGTVHDRLVAPINTMAQFNCVPWVLNPGQSLFILRGDVNALSVVNITGYERAAQAYELVG